MTTYKTSQLAEMIHVHPNTIRFYEKMELLPPVEREKNGYRIFTERHLWQLRFLKIAFRAEIISDRLRQEVYMIVKLAAGEKMEEAFLETRKYLKHLKEERKRAEDAILITEGLLSETVKTDDSIVYSGRMEMAAELNVTIDVIRDWERNGLIQVPKNLRGHREYRMEEVNRLKIIRILRSAHYSMMAILRMLHRLDEGDSNLRETLNTPEEDEDIVSATDRYISALDFAEKDALEMLNMLEHVSEKNQI